MFCRSWCSVFLLIKNEKLTFTLSCHGLININIGALIHSLTNALDCQQHMIRLLHCLLPRSVPMEKMNKKHLQFNDEMPLKTSSTFSRIYFWICWGINFRLVNAITARCSSDSTFLKMFQYNNIVRDPSYKNKQYNFYQQYKQ